MCWEKRHVFNLISSTANQKLVKFGLSCKKSLLTSISESSKNSMKNWLHNCPSKVVKISLNPLGI